MTEKRVYLAGPEVFLPDARDIAERKKTICREHGVEGVFPLDADVDIGGCASDDAAMRIAAANTDLIERCDGLIANFTPFRGPSADVGTVGELVHAAIRGRPAEAYSNVPGDYASRVRPDGLHIEDFGLCDNLMLVWYLREAGATDVHRPDSPVADPLRDLASFEIAVKALAVRWGLARKREPPLPKRRGIPCRRSDVSDRELQGSSSRFVDVRRRGLTR